jgi:FtsP/CotA-like multicopper oxidase with cupredoxin domain
MASIPESKWAAGTIVIDRRDFLTRVGAAAALGAVGGFGGRFPFAAALQGRAADISLRISPVSLEIAPGKIIKTTGYNGAVPGPIVRVKEGAPITIDVQNDTALPELVHWHGLFIPSDVDGSAEEGTPEVPAHGSRQYVIVPRPSGTRWYHTHVAGNRDLKRSTYTGQFGFLYVEPKGEPGQYDAEVFLALHGWDGYMTTGGDEDGTLEVAYTGFSINSKALGHGEPISVKAGQRVLFRILNASATTTHQIALAGHKFLVTHLDGNPVPSPREVEMLEMGPAERVDCIVTMNQPGSWVLGDLDDKMRKDGLGIVVEYANSAGAPKWVAPPKMEWDYLQFGRADAKVAEDAEIVPLVFKKKFAGNRWVDYWTINGKSYPKTDPILVQAGRRYRLRMDNQSDEAHPVHLHRHSFELINFAGKATGGILKDVVVLPAKSKVDVDFVADNPGLTLFHCHQQLHMDYGFMALVKYAD